VAQGGDWGALITEQMGVQAPPELIDIHTNMPATVPPDIAKALQAARRHPDSPADERLAYERLDFVYKKGIAYAYQSRK
jgi:hypothetical protein